MMGIEMTGHIAFRNCLVAIMLLVGAQSAAAAPHIVVDYTSGKVLDRLC